MKCFQNFLNAGSKFIFKFDCKSRYHDTDINKNFLTYLGFSWEIDGKVRRFAFTVLLLGLFKEIVHPLVKRVSWTITWAHQSPSPKHFAIRNLYIKIFKNLVVVRFTFHCTFYHFTIEEITFWKLNIQTLNKRFLTNYQLQKCILMQAIPGSVHVLK